MNHLLNRFRKHIESQGLIESNKTLLIGLSGGADSVCLFRLLLEVNVPIVALHCNFHLRGEESDRDENFVKNLCKQHETTIIIKHFDTATYAAEHKVSIEMAARDLRYAWFEEMITEYEAQGIAIAHHQDDQAETLLLNLIRGTGLRGLAGMKSRNGQIIRPLLPFTRAEILEYLSEIGQDYITDSTNLERDAQRNKIRLDIIPLLRQLNPQATANLAGAAERVSEALPYYERGISAELPNHTLSIKALMESPSPRTLLYEWLQPFGFNRKQTDQILDNIHSESGAIIASPTHQLLRDRDTLVLQEREIPDTPINIQQTIIEVPEGESAEAVLKRYPLTPDYAYVDADKIQGDIQLTTPCEGMRFQPYGQKGQSKLVSDYLTDMKLNRFEKAQQPLLMDGENIVWIVGLRSDHRYRVTAETQRILQLYKNK